MDKYSPKSPYYKLDHVMVSMGSMRRASQICVHLRIHAWHLPKMLSLRRWDMFPYSHCCSRHHIGLDKHINSHIKIPVITKIGGVRSYRSFACFVYATLDGTPWTGNKAERDTNVSFLTHKLDTQLQIANWPPLKGLTSSIYMHKLRTMLAYDSWTDKSEFHGKNIEYIAVRIRAHTNRIWRTKNSVIFD